MADLKTHLREISVATTIGLFNTETKFKREDLYSSKKLWEYATHVISNDISDAVNIKNASEFLGEMKDIVDNGYNLGRSIFENKYFKFSKNAKITWKGNDTQKDDPIDITVGDYGFSLKEESFILENMGLYKLLNCYTGSNYKKRHIFSDYARKEYENWFKVTWNELINILNKNNGYWRYNNSKKKKGGLIDIQDDNIKLTYFNDNKIIASSLLPIDCSLCTFECKTTSKIREQVFSKFINLELEHNNNYFLAKRECAIQSTKALVEELNKNLNYQAGLPRFLRIHSQEYYYAKTTKSGIEIYRVPSLSSFKNEIEIESIVSSVPNSQANILTTIKNKITGRYLVLRNECRFSHGQFNGTPEAKMYYENGGSLEVIYEKV